MVPNGQVCGSGVRTFWKLFSVFPVNEVEGDWSSAKGQKGS